MAASAEGLPAVTAQGGDTGPAGRIDVRDRVLTTVARAAAAEAIGIRGSELSARVSELGRGLAVRVRAPMPVPDLDDTAAVTAAEPIVDRAVRLQHELRDRLTTLLGRDVHRVEITVDGAIVRTKRRVS